MNVKRNIFPGLLAWLLLRLFTLDAHAVIDSSRNSQLDSLLLEKQQATTDLIGKADSIAQADSLTQARLLRAIDSLKTRDQRKRKELQAQLDSLQNAQNERRLRIKQEVDSLRINTQGLPVVLFDDTVFFIYSKLGPFSPSERAQSMVRKVELLIKEDIYDPAKLKVVSSDESSDVRHDELILLSITDRDAFWIGKARTEVAQVYLDALQLSVADYLDRTSLVRTLRRVGMLLLILFIVFLIVYIVHRIFIRAQAWMRLRGKRYLKGLRFRNYDFLSEERERQLVTWVLNFLKWVTTLIVLYLALPIVFSVFPATEGIARVLISYILDPLKDFGRALLAFVPDLITIIVVIVITRFFLRFLKFISSEVESGKLQLPGFYADWSRPTYGLLRILVYAFAFIIIFPYLPGSDSTVFQGVSVFLGLLLSLGSSSAISNIIAGLVITYMRAFKIGDRVTINNVTGDVIEKTMLVTRLRTIKNESVTIPNSTILTGNTVNFSVNAESLGLILSTTVTIGYDVPWKQVHELLVRAALKTTHIRQQPEPFVLQTGLDDFYVSYQLNAYTEEASKMARIYSELHSNIQDAFNEAGVEILSPHYRAERDGSMVTIPAQYRTTGFGKGASSEQPKENE